MTTYLLSVVTPTDGEPPSAEVLERIGAELEVIRNDLRAQGAWVFAGGLEAPSTATVVRPDGERTLVVDGPFAEGKEYIGGIAIIRAADLDQALEWARRYAGATTLAIEIRPFAGAVED
jgi:hypothetical protein